MAEAGVPSWHADPSGRHELRWWDGTNYTDQVADAGTVSTDAGPLVPATPLAAPPPAPAPPPSPAAPAGRPRRGLVLVVVLALLAVGAAIAWYAFLRDDSSGTGTFSGEAAPEALGVHEVGLDAGTVLAVRVEPGSDLDAVVAVVVSDEDAVRVEELYAELGVVEVQRLDEAFGAVDGDELDRLGDGRAVLRTDIGFAGEDEELLLAVPFAVDARVVVGPFQDDDADDYRIEIEAFGIDTDPDDDGEDVLDAVVESEDVPSRVRRLAEELLESVD